MFVLLILITRSDRTRVGHIAGWKNVRRDEAQHNSLAERLAEMLPVAICREQRPCCHRGRRRVAISSVFNSRWGTCPWITRLGVRITSGALLRGISPANAIRRGRPVKPAGCDTVTDVYLLTTHWSQQPHRQLSSHEQLRTSMPVNGDGSLPRKVGHVGDSSNRFFIGGVGDRYRTHRSDRRRTAGVRDAVHGAGGQRSGSSSVAEYA